MSTATAIDMQLDVDVLLVTPDPSPRKVHVYDADDGTSLVVELTDYEAWLLECE